MVELRAARWRAQFGKRTIVHVDMDAFFAQVEVMDNPAYRGKPLVVGGSRDSARGVVATCSYEARRFGIRSAMPIRQAVKLCPDAIFLPTRMDRYRAVSQRIREVLGSLSPLVEPVSVDEAFLDMTGCEHFYADPVQLGAEVKRRIHQATGLTCSVGVAPNKFLAKLASDRKKPNGLVIVPLDRVDAFLLPLPVEAMWGVGPKTAERLRRHGIRTVAQVRAHSLASLRGLLGDRGAQHVYQLSRGQDERPVEPLGESKSIGHEMTFETDVADGPELRAHLARLAAKVGVRMRREGVVARTVTVKIRFPDFETRTKSRSLSEGFDGDNTLFREASRLLDSFVMDRPLRLLGVYVSHFQEHAQVSLFPEVRSTDRLVEVVDALNQHLGARVVRWGRELGP